MKTLKQLLEQRAKNKLLSMIESQLDSAICVSGTSQYTIKKEYDRKGNTGWFLQVGNQTEFLLDIEIIVKIKMLSDNLVAFAKSPIDSTPYFIEDIGCTVTPVKQATIYNLHRDSYLKSLRAWLKRNPRHPDIIVIERAVEDLENSRL